MKQFLKRIAPVIALMSISSALLSVAEAAIRVTLAPNYDDTLTTAYPLGDKPQGGGTCPPATYTGANLGDGGGTICDQGSGTLAFAVTGSDSIQNSRIVYKDAGAGEVQIEGEITDSYAGSAQANAAVGLGIRETALTSSWVAQCKSLQTSSTTVQCQYGVAGSTTNVNCPSSGASRPKWVAVTYFPTDTEVKGFTSTDGSTWGECFTTIRNMSDVIAYAIGGSKSTTIALTAEIDSYALLTEIDAYTEADSPGGAPIVVTPIADQIGTQGVAFSLSCLANFSGATSYSVSGLHGSTGLSFNTSNCSFSGTLNANDAGERSVTVTATNGSGSISDTFSFAVAEVPGDLFLIPVGSGSRTYNCAITGGADGASWASIRTSGSGTTPGPGDVIAFDDGTHTGSIDFINCHGNASNRIIFRNDTTGGGPAIFRKTTGTDGPLFQMHDSTYFNLTGEGKWSGAPAGVCGVSESDPDTRGTTQCGIVIDRTSPGHPQDYIAIKGVAHNYTVGYIEIDGVTRCDAGGGHGLVNNDHTVEWHDVGLNVWRENIVFEHLYIHDVGSCGSNTGEGMYVGGNAFQDDIPIRSQVLRYSILDTTGGSGVKFKNVHQGVNEIHHNYFHDIGGPGSGAEVTAIENKNVMNLEIYANIIDTVLGSCVGVVGEALQADADVDVGYHRTFNNIFINCGTQASMKGEAFRAANNTITYGSFEIDYNTIMAPADEGIEIAGSISGAVSRNNLVIGAGGADPITGTTETNNRTAATSAAQAFVDGTGPVYDLHLTSSSPARNGAIGACKSTDFEYESRPQQSVCDQGADEYVP